MEERTPIDHRLDEMDLGIYLGILRAGWRRLALLSVAAGAISLIVTFSVPNMYQATAVITPVTEEGRQSPSIGALASLGVVVPGPNKVEDLETLFRSKDLSVRTIAKHNLWAVALADRYDSATGKMKGGWLRRLIGLARTGRPPAAWDAIRAAERLLRVEVNKKAGTIAISFESTSPEASADVVRHYLEEGKDRLQEEALDRARLNKEFIQAQIGKTVDALNRERLYVLYGQEVEREMLAKNREQFGFKVIDSPRVPDRKNGPQRLLIMLLTTLLSFLSLSIIYCVWHVERIKGSVGPKTSGE